MAEVIEKVDDVKIKALNAFTKEFNDEAIYCACAPGRVNLIGEHTDYNEGFVLPMALPLVTIIVGKPNGSNKCVIISRTEPIATDARKAVFDVDNRDAIKPGDPKWANYMKGCIVNFPAPITGFNAVVVSTVPMGSGLSSSAALEVATYTFLEAITGISVNDPRDKALGCQKAEHDFAGVPCGIMDQFISVMGKENHALLVDCRDLSITQVPMDKFDNHVFLITNSNAPHKLSSSAYRERRDDCYAAAAKLGKKSLRDVTLTDVETLKGKGVSETMIKRVIHVINENKRTIAATKALQSADYVQVGQLMNESHDSLRDNYHVSSAELDILVNTARKIQGVYGSRLTGAGFGGCTITLVLKSVVNEVIKSVNESYTGKATFYIAAASEGARLLNCKH